MRVGRQWILALQRTSDDRRRLRLFPDLPSAIKEWEPSTRISPVFAIEGLPDTGESFDLSKGEKHIIFVGPVHPSEVAPLCTRQATFWIGLGLYNVIFAFARKGDSNALKKWARARDIAFENWSLKGGVVTKTEMFRPPRDLSSIAPAIAAVASSHLLPELQEAITEYCPLMASTAARSAQLPPAMLSSVLGINVHVASTVKDVGKTPELTTYRALGELLTVNAGLSRFSSQTFAGTSPIYETECHFWSNSLLGIGVATIGLWKLCNFLSQTLGVARLPSRFGALATIPNPPNLRAADPSDSIWSADHLSGVQPLSSAPIIPVLPYFSARDGFKSTSTTVSAPLATVTSCNSLKWSLLTITHELSHILVRNMLAKLYGDLHSQKQRTELLNILNANKCATLLDEIRKLLIIAIVGMEAANSDRPASRHTEDLDDERLIHLIEAWHKEIEELFVHVFDFLYFYGKDVDKYIGGIWVSWGTIPNIAHRVREYVIRTICTILALHLRRQNPGQAAKEQVLKALRQMQKTHGEQEHVARAIEYIEKHWEDEIRQRVAARLQLVKIASTFMFSQKIATAVRRDQGIASQESETEGYKFRTGRLELRKIGNPLRFLETYTSSKAPVAADSLWMYYILAFCVE